MRVEMTGELSDSLGGPQTTSETVRRRSMSTTPVVQDLAAPADSRGHSFTDGRSGLATLRYPVRLFRKGALDPGHTRDFDSHEKLEEFLNQPDTDVNMLAPGYP